MQATTIEGPLVARNNNNNYQVTNIGQFPHECSIALYRSFKDNNYQYIQIIKSKTSKNQEPSHEKMFEN